MDEPRVAARRAAAHVIVEDLSTPILSADDGRHLRTALRLRPGETVSATDGRGAWRPCVLGGGGDLVPAGDIVEVEPPTRLVCVAFAPVKGDRNEWAVQKLTELGVDRILLIRSERSVVRWDEERATSHLEKMRRVARQALMQSRGMWLPEVAGVIDFKQAQTFEGVAIADPDGSPMTADFNTVLVGPEGGWSEAERSERRAETVRLADGVLRTESAAVAAGVLLTALRAGIVAPASS